LQAMIPSMCPPDLRAPSVPWEQRTLRFLYNGKLLQSLQECPEDSVIHVVLQNRVDEFPVKKPKKREKEPESGGTPPAMYTYQRAPPPLHQPPPPPPPPPQPQQKETTGCCVCM
jgi:hypothetical protein